MPDFSTLYPLPLGLLVLFLARRWRRGLALPRPPGPKGYPIIGNVLDLSLSVPIWESITSLSDRYATDVLYLRVLGQDIVVLSSNEAIVDLIEKRSSIYSDRPQTTMMQLTGTTSWSFAMMSYGAPWRIRRRLCHEALNVRLGKSFDGHQYKYVHRLLSCLLQEPENFIRELDFTPGAIVLSITYGIDVQSIDDEYMKASTESAHALAKALVPGKFIADIIPILRFIPDWFPGATFKVLAKETRDKFKVAVDGPMEYVKNAMKSGEGISRCITSDCLSRLENREQTSFDEGVIRDVAGAMFSAATETTKAILKMFFLAMILHPRVMKKAQEELDRVVGKGELPNFAHRDDLPYINAMVKEVLRWSPPVPFGMPVRAMQDDVYRGCFIPAGATVIGNAWAICRDPEVYPDPESFNPDRFIKDGKINPLVFNPEDRVFGAGRRICPGRDLALQTIYLVVACVLSVFNIEPALGEDGKPRMPKIEFDGAVVRDPNPFECTIKPRSEDAMKLVREARDATGCT